MERETTAGKERAVLSERYPRSWSEPEAGSNPPMWSEPEAGSNPPIWSEPRVVRQPFRQSEPQRLSNPISRSEPRSMSYPPIQSEPRHMSNPTAKSEPYERSHPTHRASRVRRETRFCGATNSMNRRPKKPCSHQGCPKTTDDRFCPEHQAAHYRAQDEHRGSASARGYGANWRRLRMMQLNREPLCRACAKRGLTVAAVVADHIIRRVLGGPDSFDNLQSLCQRCHNQKRAEESRQ
jgi:5-methylcytosine-specific restriction protein A